VYHRLGEIKETYVCKLFAYFSTIIKCISFLCHSDFNIVISKCALYVCIINVVKIQDIKNMLTLGQSAIREIFFDLAFMYIYQKERHDKYVL